MAAPFNTPPDTGRRIGRGAGLGGGSEWRSTLVLLLFATFLTSAVFVAVNLSVAIDEVGRDGAGLLGAGCLLAADSTGCSGFGSGLSFTGMAVLLALFAGADAVGLGWAEG